MQHSESAAVFSFVKLDKVYHFDYLVEKCLFIFTLNVLLEIRPCVPAFVRCAWRNFSNKDKF